MVASMSEGVHSLADTSVTWESSLVASFLGLASAQPPPCLECRAEASPAAGFLSCNCCHASRPTRPFTGHACGLRLTNSSNLRLSRRPVSSRGPLLPPDGRGLCVRPRGYAPGAGEPGANPHERDRNSGAVDAQARLQGQNVADDVASAGERRGWCKEAKDRGQRAGWGGSRRRGGRRAGGVFGTGAGG